MICNSVSSENKNPISGYGCRCVAQANLSGSEHQAVESSAIARRAPCFSARSDVYVRPSNTGNTSSEQQD